MLGITLAHMLKQACAPGWQGTAEEAGSLVEAVLGLLGMILTHVPDQALHPC